MDVRGSERRPRNPHASERASVERRLQRDGLLIAAMASGAVRDTPRNRHSSSYEEREHRRVSAPRPHHLPAQTVDTLRPVTADVLGVGVQWMYNLQNLATARSLTGEADGWLYPCSGLVGFPGTRDAGNGQGREGGVRLLQLQVVGPIVPEREPPICMECPATGRSGVPPQATECRPQAIGLKNAKAFRARVPSGQHRVGDRHPGPQATSSTFLGLVPLPPTNW